MTTGQSPKRRESNLAQNLREFLAGCTPEEVEQLLDSDMFTDKQKSAVRAVLEEQRGEALVGRALAEGRITSEEAERAQLLTEEKARELLASGTLTPEQESQVRMFLNEPSPELLAWRKGFEEGNAAAQAAASRGDESGLIRVTRGWPDLDDGPWRVTIEYARIGGRPDAVGISIRTDDRSRPLTARILRKIPFGQIRREQRENMAKAIHGEPGVMMSEPTRERLAGLADGFRQEPPRRRRMDDEFLAEVAETYRESVQRGDSPAYDIAVKYGKSVITANRWISQCRKRGLLGPARPGVPGEFPEEES